MSKSNAIKVFSRFNPPPSPSIEFTEASLTRQEFVQEADLNNIMRKYAGGLPASSAGSRPPMFGDFTQLPDYQSALDTVIKAQEAFESLPARIRERFGNDPQKVLDFLADDSNRQEAIYLGLLEKPVEKPVESSQSPKGEA